MSEIIYVCDTYHGATEDEARRRADAFVRRAFGEEPEAGTMASITTMHNGLWWRFDARHLGGAFVEWDNDGRFLGSAEVSDESLETGWFFRIPEITKCVTSDDVLFALNRAAEKGWWA